MQKDIKPSYNYLKKLTKLREDVRQHMLGQDSETQAEMRFIEKQIIEKMREVQAALSMKV